MIEERNKSWQSIEMKVVSSRLDSNRDKIIGIVRNQVERFVSTFNDDEEQDDHADSQIEQELASSIKKDVDSQVGGNWIVICGNRFSLSAGIVRDDPYVHLRVREVNIVVFRCRLTA